MDVPLFNPARRTRTYQQIAVVDAEYADDANFEDGSREHAVLGLTAFQDVSAKFGLTVSIPKTKFIVAGVGVTAVDIAGILLHGQVVENVPPLFIWVLSSLRMRLLRGWVEAFVTH